MLLLRSVANGAGPSLSDVANVVSDIGLHCLQDLGLHCLPYATGYGV